MHQNNIIITRIEIDYRVFDYMTYCIQIQKVKHLIQSKLRLKIQICTIHEIYTIVYRYTHRYCKKNYYIPMS